jgi:DNA gyrase inhibitor GyrI
MSTATPSSFRVDSRDMPPREVVFLSCSVDLATGAFSTQIADGFDQLKSWAQQQGYQAADTLIIGIPHVVERQLLAYDCCVQLPIHVSAPAANLATKQIPGGRYAILSLEKDSATIGEMIGRFFAEYVPQHDLHIDQARPSYEVYYIRTMEYCVPIR